MYPSHDRLRTPYPFTSKLRSEIARMSQHPHDPSRWGLKNAGSIEWTLLTADGKRVQVPVGRSVPLKHGLTIQFGSAEGRLLSK